MAPGFLQVRPGHLAHGRRDGQHAGLGQSVLQVTPRHMNAWKEREGRLESPGCSQMHGPRKTVDRELFLLRAPLPLSPGGQGFPWRLLILGALL